MEELASVCGKNERTVYFSEGADDTSAPPAYISGACFDDVPADMAGKLAGFINERYGLAPAQAELLREYIQTKYELNKFERQENDSLLERPAGSRFPLIHAFRRFKATAKVQEMLGLEPGKKNKQEARSVFFAVFSMKTMRAVPITAENIPLLKDMLLKLSSAKSFDEILNSFAPSEKENVMKSMAAFHNAGLIDF